LAPGFVASVRKRH